MACKQKNLNEGQKIKKEAAQQPLHPESVEGLDSGLAFIQFIGMQKMRVVRGTFGGVPFVEHFYLHFLGDARDFFRCFFIVVSQFDAVAVGVEKVNRVENAVVGDAEHIHAFAD